VINYYGLVKASTIQQVQTVQRASPFPAPPKAFPIRDLHMMLDLTLAAAADKLPKTKTSPNRQQRT